MQLKNLNRKQIDFSRRCYHLFLKCFSDLFLSSSANCRFLEVGSSCLQLYIIIVGPSFFRQRVVVYVVVIYDIHASARATSFGTRGKHGQSRRVARPEAKNTSFLRVPFQKIMYRQMHEPS